MVPMSQSLQVIFESDSALRIVAPAPMRTDSIAFLSCLIVFLVAVVWRNPAKFFVINPVSVFSWAALAVVVFFLAGIIYQNVFGAEELVIVRGTAAVTPRSQVIQANDLVAIERNAEPGAMTPEGKLEALGIGSGRLTIVTSNQRLPFGAGLSATQSIEVVESIERFCGRKLFKDRP